MSIQLRVPDFSGAILGGGMFIGYLNGKKVRHSLGLDKLRGSSKKILLVFPPNIPTISMSFIRGLLGADLEREVLEGEGFNYEIQTDRLELTKSVHRYISKIRINIRAGYREEK